jgi:hypothetical protein
MNIFLLLMLHTDKISKMLLVIHGKVQEEKCVISHVIILYIVIE